MMKKRMTMSEYLQSELPAIELFQKLGYEYFDAKSEMYEVVLQERLETSLKRINPWLNENNLQKVVRKIMGVNGSSLMEINSEIHQLITKADSLSLKPTPEEHPIPVKFIDFDDIENNDYLVVNQMKFKGTRANSIPDIVIFINGLPLVVIEAKNQTAMLTTIHEKLQHEVSQRRKAEQMLRNIKSRLAPLTRTRSATKSISQLTT